MLQKLMIPTLLLFSLQAWAVTTKLDCRGLDISGLGQFQIKATANAQGISDIQVWTYNDGQATPVFFQNSASAIPLQVATVDGSLEATYVAPGYGLNGAITIQGTANIFHFGQNHVDSRAQSLDLILDDTYVAKATKGYAATLQGNTVEFAGYDTPAYATSLTCSIFGE